MDSSSGRFLWHADVPQGTSAEAAQLGNSLVLGGSGPNNSNCHYIVALDAATGKRLWQDAGQEGLRGYPDLLPGKDCVLMADSFATRAYDLATGALLWRRKVPEHGQDVSILANNDQTVVMYNDKGFVALDGRTGNEKWRVAARNLMLQFNRGRPAILTDTMMVAWTGHHIVGHTLADGRSAWQCAYDQPIPVLAGGDHMIAAAISQEKAIVSFLDIRQGRLLGQKQLVSQAAQVTGISDPTREIVATSFGWYVRMGHEHVLLAVADEAEPGNH
jgi:outer membrane protein assembly factor BamB